MPYDGSDREAEDVPPIRYPLLEISPGGCRWPHGDPGEPDFHFCGAHAVKGRPYCSTHMAIAYVDERKQAAVIAARDLEVSSELRRIERMHEVAGCL